MMNSSLTFTACEEWSVIRSNRFRENCLHSLNVPRGLLISHSPPFLQFNGLFHLQRFFSTWGSLGWLGARLDRWLRLLFIVLLGTVDLETKLTGSFHQPPFEIHLCCSAASKLIPGVCTRHFGNASCQWELRTPKSSIWNGPALTFNFAGHNFHIANQASNETFCWRMPRTTSSSYWLKRILVSSRKDWTLAATTVGLVHTFTTCRQRILKLKWHLSP